jgi:hypothetical protein
MAALGEQTRGGGSFTTPTTCAISDTGLTTWIGFAWNDLPVSTDIAMSKMPPTNRFSMNNRENITDNTIFEQ